jgi:hypothetical protein
MISGEDLSVNGLGLGLVYEVMVLTTSLNDETALMVAHRTPDV